MVTLSGAALAVGDNVYISRAASYGQVIRVGDTSAAVRVEKDGGYRDFIVQNNGVVAGEVGASWFPPITVPLSKGDNAKYLKAQAIITKVLEVL